MQSLRRFAGFSSEHWLGTDNLGRDLFALRVVGESMINAGIYDGDIIVVNRTPVADNGDIVVAMVEDEASGGAGESVSSEAGADTVSAESGSVTIGESGERTILGNA